MLRRRVVLVLVAATVVVGFWLTQALSQQTPPDRQRPGAQARQRGDRSQRMEEFRRRAQERMREQLGATEQEWKVLQPRLEKVQQLQRQTRGGFGAFGGARGQARRGRRAGAAQPPGAQRPEGAPEREQSDVEKKTEALRNLLDDEASAAGAIKAALGALRQAREKAQKDLAAARQELRQVVTVRQEARLVLMGTLD